MIRLATVLVSLMALMARADIPYPIIFVHGLTGDYRTFEECIQGLQNVYYLPAPAVYHVCLNHDSSDLTATLDNDVAPIGFTAYGGNTTIAPSSDCRLFAINFDDDETFSKAYVLQTSGDENQLRQFMSPRLRETFNRLADKNLILEVNGDVMVIHQGRRLKPEQVSELIADAVNIRRNWS